MRPNWKREIMPAVLFAAMLVTGIYYYPILPGVVPSHFDIHGEPNGWLVKPAFFAVSFVPFVLVYVLLTFLPAIDPLKKKIEPKFGVILFFRDVSLVFSAALFFIALKAAYDRTLSVGLFGIAFGLLFLIIGNYMPKAPQNWFVGIRSPWALSSEIVWKKTHILGGWLFALAGIVFLVCVIMNFRPWIGVWAVLGAAIIPYVYSYLLYKNLQRSGRA